ncbi:hypothetical protein PTQ27_07745 [Mannheimia sp. AT1]|uniref:Uncharacterized protein n=1 Tax=Mannheimia cairinae TaxID=3025936 RepID=A0ABT5MQW3_9PAST|nr:hypothetical protein [Mannheimia cairinae]MDD0824353.1 hypothetical protein [Mannheimia cairinae]MDD0826524.1 hypothetical protein [Mannheimia cairinae]
MMTEREKSELNSQLNEAVMQLIQAQKYLNQRDFIRSGVHLSTVQDMLPKVHLKLFTANRKLHTH